MFKVGDKVRVIKDEIDGDRYLGRVGTVIKVTSMYVYVDIDIICFGCSAWEREELELVATLIGKRVRIINATFNVGIVNKTGTVVDYSVNQNKYVVKLDDISDLTKEQKYVEYFLLYEELELID